MHSLLGKEMADARAAELRGVGRRVRGRPRRADPAQVVVRRAQPADGPALAALAALDGTQPGLGDSLVAEVGGSVRAVLPLDGGRAYADPFRPTAQLVELLELRARQIRHDRRVHAHRGLLARVRPAVRRFV